MDPLLIALLALQVVDGVFTYLAIKAGGREVNPLVLAVKKLLPGKWTWLWAVKLPAAATLYYVSDSLDPAVVGGLVVFYVLIAANNFNVWRKLKG